ncbi:MAG: hypothetical protein HQ582_04025, partial [Planctomycetes bacterium]|nr:hypothetical protein [Planctomycetota bacterium]
DIETYNTQLFREGEGLLPGKLKTVRSGEPMGMHTKAVSTEVLSRLKRFGVSLTTVSTRAFITLEPTSISKSALVLTTFADGQASPAVLQKSFGRGRVVLVTTSVDTEWGNLPLDPSGAVLVHEIVAQSAGASGRGNVLEVGESIVIDWPLEAADGTFTITGPEKLKAKLHAKPKGGRYRVTYKDTRRPGFYEVASSGRRALFAANVSQTESDQAAIARNEIEAMLPGIPLKLTDASEASEAAMVAEGEMGALWPACIAAALVLFVLELALAQHFSRIR